MMIIQIKLRILLRRKFSRLRISCMVMCSDIKNILSQSDIGVLSSKS